VAPSYLKTFTVSDSVAKDDKVLSENGVLLWQDPSIRAERGGESKKQIGRISRSGPSNGFATTSRTGGGSREGNYSYLKIVEGLEPKEIIKAVEVPIQSNNAQLPQSSSRMHSGSGSNSEISRQDLAAAAKLVTARRELEEVAMSGEKKAIPLKGPIPQHVLAARQALTPSPSPPIPVQGVVATSMRTWTPETSYSPKPISPDSGLGRLTESRESEKLYSPLPSVRGYGTSNGGPMGSLPSLKDSLPSLRGSLPSLKESNPSLRSSTTLKNSFPRSLRDVHPDLREATVITNFDTGNNTGHTFAGNDASGNGLQYQERKSFQNPMENSTIPMPFRLTRPWPSLAVQIKPDSNDAQEIAKAVMESGERGNRLGIGHHQEPAGFGDPFMHPVMYASNSLKATVRKAGRGSTPNRAAELTKESMMRKNDEQFMGDPISTVKGTNYQRLMNEMREQRKIEMQRKEAEREAARRAREESSAASAQSGSNGESSKSRSRVAITSRTRNRTQPKNASNSSAAARSSVSRNTNSTKTAKEDDIDENNTSFIPQLSIITEDETCDDRSTFSFTEQICSVPPSGKSSNTLTVPNNNQHLLKMDPLIKMLYQEISEGNDTSDTNDRSKRDPGKAVGSGEEGGGGGREGNEGEKDGEEGGEGEEKEIELTPELIERVRTAIIKRQLSKKGTRSMIGGGRGNSKKEAESSGEIYGKDSILIAPPDIETLLKAAEFRGQSVTMSSCHVNVVIPKFPTTLWHVCAKS
jgi:hypothetical protein